MITSKRIEAVEKIVLQRMDAMNTSMRSLIPLSKLVDEMCARIGNADYHELPRDVVETASLMAKKFGEQGEEEFARLLIISLIKRWFRSQPISGSIGRLGEVHIRETNRILTALEQPTAGAHVLLKDEFQKDLQCFTGRMIPCGAQIVDLRSAVPRRSLVSDGILRLPQNLIFFRRAGGFSPYCEIHTHTPTLSEFNEEGWDKCYLCIAELLRRDPALKGMVGVSWFYDPELENISPRLAYLRHRPVENGARLLRIGSFESSRRDALATSETRRRLFEAGQYRPTHFALVWLRRDLLRWAKERE